MNWIKGMQRAIDYIEDNLTENLDYEKIAQKAYVSQFYFQRIFAILCDCSVGEYIRNRRLTLAGLELLSTNSKIIDLALKYGYDTPESFTRAFTRFHGVTPSMARLNSCNLKSFARLSIKISLKGGNVMNYKILNLDSFKVIVKSKRFSTITEVANKEIPVFWEKVKTDGTIDSLCTYHKKDGLLGNTLVGICEEDSKSTAEFIYSIGLEYNGNPLKEGLTLKEIPSQTWVVFECIGPMPTSIQNLWHQIYTEFFPASEYEPISGLDMEVYPEGNNQDKNYRSEIWIPVKKVS